MKPFLKSFTNKKTVFSGQGSFVRIFLSSALLSLSGSYAYAYEAPIVSQTYLHKYGVQVDANEWNRRGQQGTVISTHTDGVVVESNYMHGVLQGDTTYSFPHSNQIRKRETYKDGQLVREMTYNYGGAPSKELVQQPGSRERSITVWYEDGTPKSVEQFSGDFLVKGDYFTPTHQKDSSVNQSEGTRHVRDEFGRVSASELISGGVVVSRTSYYPNGTPSETATFKNGVMDGERKLFNPGGDPISIENWVNGYRQGITYNYAHGEKQAEVPYENGLKNGIERRFRDGALVIQEISWINDVQHGPSTTYYPGDKSITEWYYQGAIVSKPKYDLLSARPNKR